MLKFALALGITFEWLLGPSVDSVTALGYASLRTVCATLFAWMVLEACRALFLGALSLDDVAPALRRRPR
jgi:hypothetical protein